MATTEAQEVQSPSESIEKHAPLQNQEPYRRKRDTAFWMVFVAGWACDMLSALDFVSNLRLFARFALILVFVDCSINCSSDHRREVGWRRLYLGGKCVCASLDSVPSYVRRLGVDFRP